MAEYIEREALIEKIVNTPTVPIKQCYEGNFVYADGTASRQNEIINYITEQPASDVVEVVRCKDCKHYVANYCTRDIKGRTNMFYMTENDFCSYGVRKEGAEKCLEAFTPEDIIRQQQETINRQKAEEETMQSYIDCLKAEIEDMNNLVVYNAACATKLQLKLVEAKAEAAKEFAERLKEKVESYDVYDGYKITIRFAVEEDTIDNLVKEMVGES